MTKANKSNDLLFHSQPTCFVFISLDCWLIPSSWNFLHHGLSKHCFSMILPTSFSTFSLSSNIYFCTQMRCSPKFFLWLSSFLILFPRDLFYYPNFTYFLWLYLQKDNYWYSFKPHMFIYLLVNCSYILNLYFKSKKFKNNFSPNAIFTLNLIHSYLKRNGLGSICSDYYDKVK